MAHAPIQTQLPQDQSLIEIGVDKNTTVVFPAPLMSTIGDLGAFLQRETKAAGEIGGEIGGEVDHLPATTPQRTGGPELPVDAVGGRAVAARR